MAELKVTTKVAAWFKSDEGQSVLKDVREQTRVDRVDIIATNNGGVLQIHAEDQVLTSLANSLLDIHITNQEKLLTGKSSTELEELEGKRISFTGKSSCLCVFTKSNYAV